MRFLHATLLSVCLFICSPANATFIQFNPSLSLSTARFLNFRTDDFETILLGVENLSIVNSSTQTSSTGTGFARASVNGGGPSIAGSISANLGVGPGSARATALSFSTFDLVFPRPGSYVVPADLEVSGTIDIEPGDEGFTSFEIFFEFPTRGDIGFGGTFGDTFGSQSDPFRCIGGGCQFAFDTNATDLSIDIGDDLRLPVNTTLFFDVGISRAVVIPEPNTLVLTLVALLWMTSSAKGWCHRRRISKRGST